MSFEGGYRVRGDGEVEGGLCEVGEGRGRVGASSGAEFGLGRSFALYSTV